VSQTTTATGYIRKVRGAAQAHLLRAQDGYLYAVKFRNNPQHRRILVNELVAAAILLHSRISTPESVIINITDDFLSDNPEVYLQLRTKRSVVPGCHFGSRYPVDMENAAVYDSLPDSLLNKIVNASDFLGVYVVDRWLANSNASQCIFFRIASEKPANSSRFIMQSIGYGGAFDGARWQFPDSSSLKMNFRPAVYGNVTSIDSFQPWLDEVLRFPERAIEQVIEQVPESWLKSDDASLHKVMLRNLLSRRAKVADLIRASSMHTLNPFPNWNQPPPPSIVSTLIN
jgi:hypothetical protein